MRLNCILRVILISCWRFNVEANLNRLFWRCFRRICLESYLLSLGCLVLYFRFWTFLWRIQIKFHFFSLNWRLALLWTKHFEINLFCFWRLLLWRIQIKLKFLRILFLILLLYDNLLKFHQWRGRLHIKERFLIY